jgi:hypothetical protein
MKPLNEHRNNCVPVALQLVSQRPEQEVLELCIRHGYTERSGMFERGWVEAARLLGLLPRPVAVSRDRASLLGGAYSGMTLHEFCKTYRDGVHLVRVKGHLLIVNRGVVVDPNMRRRGGRRRVFSAYRVVSDLPAPRPDKLPDDPVVRFVRIPLDARRLGSDGHRRYVTAYDSDPARLSEVLARAERRAQAWNLPPYTRKDFRADLRKGNVIIEEVKS